MVFHHERSLTPIEYTKANSNLPATGNTVKRELIARKTVNAVHKMDGFLTLQKQAQIGLLYSNRQF